MDPRIARVMASAITREQRLKSLLRTTPPTPPTPPTPRSELHPGAKIPPVLGGWLWLTHLLSSRLPGVAS